MPCLCRWCDVSHLGHCTESSTLHCCFMFRGVLWVFSSLCFSYAEFTLQDYSPDFPLHILQIAYTKASRSEASGHLLSALKLVLDRYVWTVERRDPLACRTISRRLNIWLCRGQMREPCNELQPMRTGKGCGGKESRRRDRRALEQSQPGYEDWRPHRLVRDSSWWKILYCMTLSRWSFMLRANYKKFKIPDYKTDICVVWTVQRYDNFKSHAVWPRH